MRLKFEADLGYKPTMGALMDAVEQAHLAGFDARDCQVDFVADRAGHKQLVAERRVQGQEAE